MSSAALKFVAIAAVAMFAASRASAAVARLTIEEVRQLAEKTVQRDGLSIEPLMLRTIAEIESDRNPLAMRAEPQIGDASIGMMQTLLGTAKWLYKDMGAVRYGEPTIEKLFNPEVSMYFAGQMLEWLSDYRRIERGEQFIAMSYNGGPGANNNQTRHYWQKYQQRKARLVAHDNENRGA